MRASLHLAVCSALIVTSVAAYAEDTVVVTATRTRQALSEVGQTISVIESEEIRRRQSDSVVDLLRNLPGVTIARNGGIGTSTSVFIRGADSPQTVVLIDGVKLNDPSSPAGGFDFGNLLVGNVARIEVLRGSQSVLWGSQAMGGVVNLTTLEPTDELSANVRAEYGWRNTRQLVGNVSKRLGRVAASVGAGEFRTDGISAFDERLGGTERDGYRNFGANAKFNVELTEAVSVDLRGWYSDGKAGFDGFPPPSFTLADTREYTRTREAVGYSALNVALLDGRFHNRIAAAYTETKRRSLDPDGFLFETFAGRGRNTRFEYQGILDITKTMRATFGLESERSRFVSTSFGGAPTRGETRINSGYAELMAQPLSGLTTTIGVRHDHHDEFGGHTTAGASAAWSLNDGRTILRASYSEGFKAPTLYQLQSEFGNEHLRPETARGFDAGVTERLLGGRVELGATVFRRDSHDLIDFISCTPPLTGICANRPSGTYSNVARARAKGVELTALAQPIESLQLQANYTHVTTEDRSADSANFGNDLVRRPRNTLSALIDYRWSFRLQTGLTLTHVGPSFDDVANTRRIEGFDVVDVRFAYPFTDNLELQARVENLLDEQYETTFQYGMPGRAAYVGARLSY